MHEPQHTTPTPHRNEPFYQYTRRARLQEALANVIATADTEYVQDLEQAAGETVSALHRDPAYRQAIAEHMLQDLVGCLHAASDAELATRKLFADK